MINVLKNDNSFSPSEVRNYVNYVSEISIDEIDNKIICPQMKISEFIKNLSKFTYNKSYLSQMTFSMLIGQYIHLFNTKIIEDIQLRNTRSFKLKKKYEKLKKL